MVLLHTARRVHVSRSLRFQRHFRRVLRQIWALSHINNFVRAAQSRRLIKRGQFLLPVRHNCVGFWLKALKQDWLPSAIGRLQMSSIVVHTVAQLMRIRLIILTLTNSGRLAFKKILVFALYKLDSKALTLTILTILRSKT